MGIVILFGSLLICLLLNIPIAIAIGIAGVIYCLIEGTIPLSMFIQSSFNASNSFALLAVPLFILAGELMNTGGIAKRIINFSKTIVGSFTGGLGYITIFASLLFSAISGSGVATVAAIGGIMIPAMKAMGYKDSYSTTLVATAGAMGPIIPPSIIFIIYGVIGSVSITGLFIAGIIPGVLVAIALIILNYFISKKEKYHGEKRSSIREILNSLNDAKFALLTPVIILGGIYLGVFTPTESAAVAVLYCLLVSGLIYKELKIKDLFDIFMRASLTSGSVLIIVGTSIFFGRLLALEQVPQKLADVLLGVTANPYIILLIVTIMLLIVGMFMETIAAILIFVPLLLPIVTQSGIDPTHFGVIVCFALAIGLFTPPVGLNLFVASKIANISFASTWRYLNVFIIAFLIILLVIMYIPQVSLFLPSLLK